MKTARLAKPDWQELRLTNRQPDRQMKRRTDNHQGGRQAGIETYKQTYIHTGRQMKRWTDNQVGRVIRTDRQTNRESGRPTGLTRPSWVKFFF